MVLRFFRMLGAVLLLAGCQSRAPSTAFADTPSSGDAAFAATPAPAAPVTTSIEASGFGKVAVRYPRDPSSARAVVLSLGATTTIVPDDVVVVEIPVAAWKKATEGASRKCWYPAGELETLAQAVERQLALPAYLHPILFGEGWGAAVAWAALAAAPSETFAGAVALGFCPRFSFGRSLCGNAEWHATAPPTPGLGPRANLPPWRAASGDVPRFTVVSEGNEAGSAACPSFEGWKQAMGNHFRVVGSAAEGLAPYLEKERPAPVAQLPAHVEASELRSQLDALHLPLTVVLPSAASKGGDSGDPLKRVFIFVSGDGGWMEIDASIASVLAARGTAVVGWSSLAYFWQARTPQDFLADLRRVVDAIPADLPVAAGGYSFGAEVVPVVLAAGNEGSERRIRQIAVIGPSHYATFEVSPLGWISSHSPVSEWPVLDSFSKLGTFERHSLCIEAEEGDDSGCPTNDSFVTTVRHTGGHHFDGDYRGLARIIEDWLERT
jgi:type IV secretory pathway VirJ component